MIGPDKRPQGLPKKYYSKEGWQTMLDLITHIRFDIIKQVPISKDHIIADLHSLKELHLHS
jgi:hypothetical protein